jgi:uncharacterized membrane protein YdbT with pleckstrin-like domain
VITDQRVITQTGAIGLDTRYLSLDKIQEVFVRVNVLDRIFGTGNIFAITAGEVYVGTARGGAPLRPSIASINEPYKVGKLLEEA